MKKGIKNATVGNLLVIGFLLIVFLAPFMSNVQENMDFACTLSFAVNGFLFVMGIYQANRRRSISMELIYWLFMFFFMYFAPFIQYRFNVYPWRGYVTEDEVLHANALVLLFNVLFAGGCWIARRTKVVGFPDTGFTGWLCSRLEFKNKSKIILTLIICACAAYSLSKTGLMGIFVSRSQAVQVFYSGDNSAVELIVESVVPSFMAYVVAEAAQSVVKKKEGCFRFILLFVCLLICFFPTAIPRYKAATIYGVVLVMLFPQVCKGSRFFWLFTIGLFILFPLLNSFRHIISQESIQSVINKGFFESYTDGNYDAWRMLVSAVRYNEAYGCTFGSQLLGVLLFFIPSAIWTSKPIGSGAMLIKTELGSQTFSNVSCPFIAEGYVNFGIIGIVIFALFLGILITKLDKKYWENIGTNKNGMFAPYLFLVFMLFFVMRGDLLSGFAYLCGFVATGFLLKPFAKKA